MFFRVSGIVLISLIFFSSCTVVKHGEEKETKGDEVTFYFESEEFDATSYVADAWESRIIPEITERAIDLNEMLQAISADESAASGQYGSRKDESSPFNYVVKGQYPVKELDRSSAAGMLVLDAPDLSGDGFCKIQIGPVIKKSAVRDSLSFINFGDFSNQIEYANISREINFRVRDKVVSVLSEELPEGSRISFHGVFTYDSAGTVVITPVLLDVTPGE